MFFFILHPSCFILGVPPERPTCETAGRSQQFPVILGLIRLD